MENVFYPKWKYHADREPVLVRDAAQDKALGAEWAESPAEFIKSESPAAVERQVEPVESPQAAPAPEAPHRSHRAGRRKA